MDAPGTANPNHDSGTDSYNPQSRLVLAATASVGIGGPDLPGISDVTRRHDPMPGTGQLERILEQVRYRNAQCALGHSGIMRCTGTSAEVGIR